MFGLDFFRMTFKVHQSCSISKPIRKSYIFKVFLLRHFSAELANDCWFSVYSTISKFIWARFFYIWLSFFVTWLWSSAVTQGWKIMEVLTAVCMWLIFILYHYWTAFC